MDPQTLSFPAAAAVLNCELLQHCQSRTGTEMTPLSPCATFSSLELNTKRGLVNKSALPFPLPPFLLVFAALLQPDSDYKELNYYSNWKNGWTFSLAEDWEGGSVGGRTLCVWGGSGEQVERRGREFRVGGGWGG